MIFVHVRQSWATYDDLHPFGLYPSISGQNRQLYLLQQLWSYWKLILVLEFRIYKTAQQLPQMLLKVKMIMLSRVLCRWQIHSKTCASKQCWSNSHEISSFIRKRGSEYGRRVAQSKETLQKTSALRICFQVCWEQFVSVFVLTAKPTYEKKRCSKCSKRGDFPWKEGSWCECYMSSNDPRTTKNASVHYN